MSKIPQELVDYDGTRWVYDPEADTYQPGDSVPVPSFLFQHVWPELYALFHPEEPDEAQ